MRKLAIADLWRLEEYAEQRAAFRRQVLAHKRNRTLALGPNMTLLFEDRLLVQYQIQEMLRVERIFEKTAIQEELDAYNPLIPDGSNWKATCLIEYPEITERRRQLAALRGVEDHIWAQVGDHPRVQAVADEDLDRSDEAKTSAVHFLRFELAPGMIGALRSGAGLRFGADHAAYRHEVQVPDAVRESLLRDLGKDPAPG